jgi:FkbM family methyltransferase
LSIGIAGWLARALTNVQFRGKARLLHGLSPRQGTTTRRLFGYTIELDRSDFIQRAVYLGVYEPDETRLLRGYLKPGMVVVDAGANIGYYTLLAASIGCTVHAFEPSPAIFAQLARTIEANGLTGVHLIEAGLSDIDATLRLPVPHEDNHTPSLLDETASAHDEVKVMRLDDYLESNHIKRVDLLKMDVEGFEPNILRGARRALDEHRIGAVMCEFNDYWLRQNHTTPEEFFAEVCDYGFQMVYGSLRNATQTMFFTMT